MKFIMQPSQVTLRFEGMEQLWVLKRRLQIPRYAIADVGYEPDIPAVQDFNGRLRMFGTAVPFTFVAGTFRKGGSHEFWYVQLKQPGILTIELKPDTLQYERIRITCSEDMAQALTDWWQAETVTPVS